MDKGREMAMKECAWWMFACWKSVASLFASRSTFRDSSELLIKVAPLQLCGNSPCVVIRWLYQTAEEAHHWAEEERTSHVMWLNPFSWGVWFTEDFTSVEVDYIRFWIWREEYSCNDIYRALFFHSQIVSNVDKNVTRPQVSKKFHLSCSIKRELPTNPAVNLRCPCL